MADSDFPRSNWRQTIRDGADSILGLLQTRLQLFAIELQEERYRLVRVALWIGVAVSFSIVALAMVILTMAVVAWQLGELLGLAVLTVLLLGAAACCLIGLYKHLKTLPPPFPATIAEFKKDRDWLTGPH